MPMQVLIFFRNDLEHSVSHSALFNASAASGVNGPRGLGSGALGSAESLVINIKNKEE